MASRHSTAVRSVLFPTLARVAAGRFPRSDHSLVVSALGSVITAEFVTTYVSPLYGVLAHAWLLGAFLTLSAQVRPGRRRLLLSSLSIAPLIRILTLSIPLTRFPQADWYVLTSVPVFATTLLVVRSFHLPPAAIGLRLGSRRHALIQVLVALGGIALGCVEWIILRPPPIVPVHARDLVPLGFLAVVDLLVCTGFMEELVFRGLIQTAVISVLGPQAGLICTALLFAALHIGWKSPLDLVFVFFAAYSFGLVVRRTGSILGVTVAHGSINMMLFVVLPLAASR